MQLRCKFYEVRCNLDELRCNLDGLRCNLDELRYDLDANLRKNGKINPRIRLTSAKVLVEVEAKLR